MPVIKKNNIKQETYNLKNLFREKEPVDRNTPRVYSLDEFFKEDSKVQDDSSSLRDYRFVEEDKQSDDYYIFYDRDSSSSVSE